MSRAPYHEQSACRLCPAEDGQPGVSVAVIDIHPGGGLRHMEVPLCRLCREHETGRAEAMVRDQLGAHLDPETRRPPLPSAADCEVCGAPVDWTSWCPRCERDDDIAAPDEQGHRIGGEAS